MLVLKVTSDDKSGFVCAIGKVSILDLDLVKELEWQQIIVFRSVD
jgi:hypothetical protein